MKLSIIIPTFNRDRLLYKGLMFLSEQKIESVDIEWEIIIVDDGSTDKTNEFIKKMQQKIKNLNYIYLPREQISNLSRARNIGLKNALGEIICFMDSGILVPQNFVEIILNRYKTYKANKLVLIHYVFGLILEDSKENAGSVEAIRPSNIREQTKEWLLNQQWIDVRDGLFDMVDDELGKLPAPWTLGWGAMITVPKKLALDLNGYDESFFGWGVEDQDFSYRLFKREAIFRSEREAFGFHIPHPTSSTEEKMKTSIGNRKLMHKKYNTLETELFYLYNGLYYNHVLAKLNSLVITNAFQPIYSPGLAKKINDQYLSKSLHSLLLGVDNTSIASMFETTYVFTHNRSTYNKFGKELVGRSIYYLMGCDTPFEDRYFDVVILTDFIRILGQKLLQDMLVELTRISHKIVFLCATNTTFSDDSYSWIDLCEFKEMARKLNVELDIIEFC